MFYVNSEQAREIDHLSAEFFGVEIAQMMENAGKAAARLVKDKEGCRGKEIVVLAGKGHNGGGALACARFLHNWGASVHCIIANNADSLKPPTRHHSGTLKSMFVPVLYPIDAMKFDRLISKADAVVDGLLGYGISRKPEGIYEDLINSVNRSKCKTFSIDLPSGMSADGEIPGPCINANYTLSLAVPKKAFESSDEKKKLGELWVCDIGVPKEVYEKMEIDVGVPDMFRKGDLVKL